MQSLLNIDARQDAGVSILELSGRVRMNNAHKLKAAVRAALDAGANAVLVYLPQLEYMDSSGVGILITCLKMCKENHTPLMLVAPPEKVYNILDITNLCRVFTIKKSLAEAYADLGIEGSA